MTSKTITNAKKGEELVIEMPSQETHCPLCGAEYKNIQHPLKPPGVIIQRQCKCKLEFEEKEPGVTVTRLVPPPKH
jgi:hypothetical protein